MLSRTADSLFWLGRYVERADNTARIIDAASRLATMPIAYAGTTNEWESALSAAGALRAFDEHYPEADRDAVDRLPRLLSGQSVEHPHLPRHRAQQRPRGAHRAHRRDVGGDQRRLDRAEALRRDADGPADAERLPRPRQGGLPPLRRLGLPDHAAERRLLLSPPRLLSRARRQHRPHPRREVPRAASRAAPMSAAASTISSGPRSCARSRRSPPIAGSITRASSPG